MYIFLEIVILSNNLIYIYETRSYSVSWNQYPIPINIKLYFLKISRYINKGIIFSKGNSQFPASNIKQFYYSFKYL